MKKVLGILLIAFALLVLCTCEEEPPYEPYTTTYVEDTLTINITDVANYKVYKVWDWESNTYTEVIERYSLDGCNMNVYLYTSAGEYVSQEREQLVDNGKILVTIKREYATSKLFTEGSKFGVFLYLQRPDLGINIASAPYYHNVVNTYYFENGRAIGVIVHDGQCEIALSDYMPDFNIGN